MDNASGPWRLGSETRPLGEKAIGRSGGYGDPGRAAGYAWIGPGYQLDKA